MIQLICEYLYLLKIYLNQYVEIVLGGSNSFNTYQLKRQKLKAKECVQLLFSLQQTHPRTEWRW